MSPIKQTLCRRLTLQFARTTAWLAWLLLLVAVPAWVGPALAVTPKTPGDDDKIGVGLHRIAEEDPTLRVERNASSRSPHIGTLP